MTERRLVVVVCAILAASVNACTGHTGEGSIKLGPADTGPGTLAAARKYLEGRWTLLSYEVYRPSGPPIALKGNGLLTYDDFGNLTIDIKAEPETAKVLAAAGIETTKDGRLVTSGRTVVDMQKRTLTYVLEGAPPPGAPTAPPTGPLDLKVPRHWQVDGNILTLTTNGADGKPTSVGKWQKVS